MQGTLLPGFVTVVRGKKTVECTMSMNTHLVAGNRVRLGRWTFTVMEMKDKYKTAVLDEVIPGDFELKPPDQGTYVDPWGRKVEEDSDSDDDLRGKDRAVRSTHEGLFACSICALPQHDAPCQEKRKRPLRGLEIYRLPADSHGVKQVKKLGNKGKWVRSTRCTDCFPMAPPYHSTVQLLKKAGFFGGTGETAVLKRVKRYKNKFEEEAANDKAELQVWRQPISCGGASALTSCPCILLCVQKWKVVEDPDTGAKTWEHEETGEVRTDDPVEEFNRKELARASAKELVGASAGRRCCAAVNLTPSACLQHIDDEKRAQLKFQKEQMQAKIAAMKRKAKGVKSRNTPTLTEEEKVARKRRVKAMAGRRKR